jgi:TolB-like protein/DNA-binding winged helix-turn-helix (wHTH) protein/tetratricopeptide (TPR) repeat protein
MPDTTQVPAVRRFGAFEVNLQSGELRKNGMRLRLSGQPFQVLAVLVRRPGEVVTREELHSELWPADTFVDFDHGLNNAVARIREVLDDSSATPRYVETIPRRGYRFIADIRLSEPLTPPVDPALVPADEITRSDASPHSVPLGVRSFYSRHRRGLLAAVAVLVVIALGLLLYRIRSGKSAKQPTISSLAVLPLKNLSGDPAQEYFADGMTEAIIGRLSAIHDLRVVSRTSVMRFKDTQLSAPQIAKTLGVDAIVEGSVIREGGRIRVNAQLIRASTDEHFWSQAYDREMRDVLSLQSDVAEAIAGKVEVTVTGQEHSRLVAAGHVSPEVYESYLKGEFGKNNNRAEVEESIAHFEEAIRKDPMFAPAYVGLANAYDSLSAILVGGNPGELRPKVTNAARKALELDPELAEAHAVLAGIYQGQWHWSEAEAEYKRALELKPNDVAAHLGYANWLLCQGRMEEALAWSRRARELDPLEVSGVSSGWILFHARRYDEAIRELRSVLAVYPDYAAARWFLGFALIEKGQPEEAIPELEKTVSMMHRSPGSIELLATAYARAGSRREALGLINELKRRRQKSYVPAGAFINPYLGLGNYDEAFVWFERAYQEQSNILQFLKVHPFFDPVRNDPRFKDLLHRVGLD